MLAQFTDDAFSVMDTVGLADAIAEGDI